VRPAAQYLSLASPRKSHQREGDPTVRVPFRATCGARFRRGPRKLASLKQRAALIRLKLCSSARTEGGEPNNPSGHRCARPRPPHRARRRHWGRITMQRSETRAQTPIPEQRTRPHGPLHPGPAPCCKELTADENIERKWPLALDGRALPAINFNLNELEHSAAGTFAPWISISSFHRNVVGLLSARHCRTRVAASREI